MIELNKIYCGDCLELMKEMPDNSVDSIVTDPPYGISFMGKKWDYKIPGVDVWKEALRVLKPGGYALIACGTRTQHRMAVNIEDAGFEIRDLIAWVYGSGFPKSLNVGKAIDKMQGNDREVLGTQKRTGRSAGILGKKTAITHIHDKGNSPYEGWGTALKPAMELWTLARKPLSEKTVAANVLKWGTGGINVDGCRVNLVNNDDTKRAKGGHKTSYIGGHIEKNYGIENQADRDLGRFPANLIHDGSDEVVEGFPNTKSGLMKQKIGGGKFNVFGKQYPRDVETIGDSGSAARFFKQISVDNICSLCYITICKDNNKEETWKSISANSAEKNLKTSPAITESIAHSNVGGLPVEKLVHFVKSVGNLCDSCATNFVQEVVVISHSDSSQETLQVIQDFTGNYKKCILLQSLVQYVEVMVSIDTTPTMENLLTLFGSANLVITNYIQEIKKSEPSRLIYAPKASKAERNKGLYGMEEKLKPGTEFRPSYLEKFETTGDKGSPRARFGKMKNNHPTVKPIKLMRYLCRLITPPKGIVLDPYAGSGTTCISALIEAFRFIGMDDTPGYCEIGNRRIESEQQKPRLFFT